MKLGFCFKVKSVADQTRTAHTKLSSMHAKDHMSYQKLNMEIRTKYNKVGKLKISSIID